MAQFGRTLGRPSGDSRRDIGELYDYIAYLVEQLEYSNALLEKRLAAAEKAALAAQEQEG